VRSFGFRGGSVGRVVQGSQFWVWGQRLRFLEFSMKGRVWGLLFKVSNVKVGFEGEGFWFWFQILGSGIWVLGFWTQGKELRVNCVGCRV